MVAVSVLVLHSFAISSFHMVRNRGYVYTEVAPRRAGGLRLLDYLAGRYTHSTRAEWARRIAEGRVRVGGRAAKPDRVLRSGERIEWHRPPWDEPEAPRTFALLHRDAELLAVAKPAGLPTLPGGGFLENTLLAAVRERFPGASPVHRLGRWTSGLILFARSSAAAAALSTAWREGRVLKVYRALAVGSPEKDEFPVEVPIGPVPHPLLGEVHAASSSGRPASSRVRVIERREGSFLCDVTILTGRPHQIRIHLAAAGHPLAGDPLYPVGGVPAPDTRVLPGHPGYRLHSMRLELERPGGPPLRMFCQPPGELRT